MTTSERRRSLLRYPALTRAKMIAHERRVLARVRRETKLGKVVSATFLSRVSLNTMARLEAKGLVRYVNSRFGYVARVRRAS